MLGDRYVSWVTGIYPGWHVRMLDDIYASWVKSDKSLRCNVFGARGGSNGHLASDQRWYSSNRPPAHRPL